MTYRSDLLVDTQSALEEREELITLLSRGRLLHRCEAWRRRRPGPSIFLGLGVVGPSRSHKLSLSTALFQLFANTARFLGDDFGLLPKLVYGLVLGSTITLSRHRVGIMHGYRGRGSGCMMGLRLIGREERLVDRSESLHYFIHGIAAENDALFDLVFLNKLRPKRVLDPE
jgi:hypothetical protein